MDDERYTLQELADAAGVSPRTVRYYIAEGLLPPPEPAGHRTSYTGAHLLRLNLIGLLKEAYLPLKEIRTRLAELRDRDLESALATEMRARNPATANVRGMAEPRSPYQADASLTKHLLRTSEERAESAPETHSAPSEDALAYIDRVLGKQRSRQSRPAQPGAPRMQRDMIWRHLPIGSSGEAELVISEALYQRRKDRIDALLVWAEKMLEQD